MKDSNEESKRQQRDIWDRCVMEAFRECGIRFRIASKRYKNLSPKFLTSKRGFIGSVHQKLWGSLGWQDQKPYQFVPKRTRRAALLWIQEQVYEYCVQQKWPWVIYIDPSFLDHPGFQPLSRSQKKPLKKALAQEEDRDRRINQGSVRRAEQVVPIPYLSTKPRYLGTRPKDPTLPRDVKIGDGKYIFMNPQPEPVRSPNGSVSDYEQNLPWGVMCTQLEIYAFNVWRQTKALFLAWDVPSEIMAAIGYAAHDKNYKTLLRTIRDMTWCSQMFQESGSDKALDLKPFLGYSLWDKEPAKKDKLGRRNPGRRRISTDQKALVPSYVYFNPAFLSHASFAYEHVDMRLLNQWASSKSFLRYSLYLKCVEWGTRDQPGLVPFWGGDALASELDLGHQTRKNARRTLKNAFRAVKSECGCPHEIKGDAIRYYPWRQQGDRYKVPVPHATTQLMHLGVSLNELVQMRDETLKYLEKTIDPTPKERDTE